MYVAEKLLPEAGSLHGRTSLERPCLAWHIAGWSYLDSHKHPVSIHVSALPERRGTRHFYQWNPLNCGIVSQRRLDMVTLCHIVIAWAGQD